MRTLHPVLLVCAALGALALGAWLVTRSASRPEALAGSPAAHTTAPQHMPHAEMLGAPRAASAERAEVPSEGAAPGTLDSILRVRVLDAHGEGLPGARVFLCDPDWRSAGWEEAPNPGLRTDETGVARFRAAPTGRVVVVAGAPGYLPVRAALAPAIEDVTLELSTDLSLAGVVYVDGAPPPASPLELRVTGFRDPTAAWCDAARRAVNDMGLGESRVALNTGEGGTFALFGIPPGEIVELEIPATLRFREPPRDRRALTTVATGLLLDLTRLPALTGRPVGEVTGDGHVQIHFRFARANGAVREGKVSGRISEPFTIPFAETDIQEASVEIRRGFGFGGELLAARAAGPLHESHDFGDIPIEVAERSFALDVRDSAGAPIATARAVVSGRLREPADDTGRIRMKLRPGDAAVTVGAFGFEVTRVELPPPPQESIAVTLRDANRLRIVVAAADGRTPSRGLRVALHLSGEYPDDSPELVSGFEVVHGPAPGAGEWTSGGSRTHYYDLPESGPETGFLELCDMPVESGIGVEVQDRYQNEVVTAELQLARGEHRELLLRLPRSPVVIEGRVVDPADEPLAGAEVSVGGWFSEQTTGADGRFRFDNVYAEEPWISISASGFAGFTLEGPEVLRRETFALELARTVWVEVVDPNGERKNARVHVELPDGTRYGGAERSTGFHECSAVPLRPAVVKARADDGAEGEVPIGANQTQARIALR